ncbi:unnamed protein product, partial [Heterotrigona itama]
VRSSNNVKHQQFFISTNYCDAKLTSRRTIFFLKAETFCKTVHILLSCMQELDEILCMSRFH